MVFKLYQTCLWYCSCAVCHFSVYYSHMVPDASWVNIPLHNYPQTLGFQDSHLCYSKLRCKSRRWQIPLCVLLTQLVFTLQGYYPNPMWVSAWGVQEPDSHRTGHIWTECDIKKNNNKTTSKTTSKRVWS